MSTDLTKIPVTMIKDNLHNILSFKLPDNVSVKWYQPGDEQLWLDIHLKADKYNHITPSLFDKTFGFFPEELGHRQCFLLDENEKAVGTATAWFNNNYNGMPYGRLHWVAIIPEKQRQGLGKPLMTIICNQLKKLGHEKAYLTTLPLRITAINLYRKFGFIPEIQCSQDSRLWQTIGSRLK